MSFRRTEKSRFAGFWRSVRNTVCVSNLKQLGCAEHLYADDFNNMFTWFYDIAPGGETIAWHYRLSPYVGVRADATGSTPSRYTSVFGCPQYRVTYKLNEKHEIAGSPGLSYSSFALNGFMLIYSQWRCSRAVVPDAGAYVIMGEFGLRNGDGVWPQFGRNASVSPEVPDLRHSGGNNYLFADGHVERRKGSPCDDAPPAENIWRWW